MKFIKIIAIGLAIIIAIILIKFKPSYKVSLDGKELGYIQGKNEFCEEVNLNILNQNEEGIAFVEIGNIEYTFSLITKNQINNDKVYNEIKSAAKKIYRVYEIADLNNQEEKIYVNSMEEAEKIVTELKESYNEIEPNLVINQIYLENVNEVNEENIKVAKENIEKELQEQLEEKEEIESRTINGIYLACVPTTGRITSRFGANESIRDHTHQGIDIGAPAGTPILATADGTITFAGWSSGYGYLVKIDHGNGVETYYGHCSRLYVKKGAIVKAGDKIAAVGSTGNSTGNHLHFEIRLNGKQVNPQTYVYQ